jgi:hypothetical protein
VTGAAATGAGVSTTGAAAAAAGAGADAAAPSAMIASSAPTANGLINLNNNFLQSSCNW